MLNRFIALILVVHLDAATTGAQIAVGRTQRSSYVDPQIPQADQNTDARNLGRIELAESDLWLGYNVGEAYEKGEIHALNMSDIDAAVYWYKRAEQGLMHGGLYRIGVLLKQQRLLIRDEHGLLRPDPREGQRYINEALAKGFNPERDTCCGVPKPTTPAPATATSSSSTSADDAKIAAMIFGATAFFAIVAGSSTSNSSASNSAATPTRNDSTPASSLKTCTIYYQETVPYDPTYPGNARTVQKSRIGSSYECP